jgi:two-component system, NarL family, response regulator LiaR
MVNPIRVAVVDDHRLFLLAVRTVLKSVEDIEVVGEADSGTKALALVASTQPDLLLMDVKMPQLDGISCLDMIVSRHPEVKVAMISASHEADLIETALGHGASAFIQKTIRPDDLASVIRHIVTGTVVQSMGRMQPEAAQSQAAAAADLTDRELLILQALARGLSNDAIAKELWIACPTVKFHVRNVYRKLGVSNRTEAARYAYRHGLVPDAAEDVATVV